MSAAVEKDDARTIERAPLPDLPSTLPQAASSPVLPRGFHVAGVHAGIKATGALDLGVVVPTGAPIPVALTTTTSRLPAAPVRMNQAHLLATSGGASESHGLASAMMVTSGCANAATGAPGEADQARLAQVLAEAIERPADQILAMSTGLIGTRLPVATIEPTLADTVAGGLGSDDADWLAVAEAMRTTDSRPKVASIRLALPDADGRPVEVTVSGVAKGVGMIHPNMATMLSFVLTDADVDADLLHRLLRPIVARTWDQISVDGDQSTNDTVILAASAAAGAAPLTEGSDDATRFASALEAVARSLARQQAADGEGAATLITCAVTGARDDADARAVAREVVRSNLVKAAVHGADPNWGRMIAAIGNANVAPAAVLEAAGLSATESSDRAHSPVEIDPDRLRIDVCGVPVFAAIPVPFDEPATSARMRSDEVVFRIDLGLGDGMGEAFGCDLTERYVIENSEYST